VTSTRRGRPTNAQAEQLDLAVREGALAVFLEHGFSGASMDAIARAAGITRKSLYARYADKRAVFADVIPWALARLDEQDSAAPFPDTDDLEADLLGFGRMAVRRATHADNVRLKRIAMTEVGQFTEFSVTADSMMWAARVQALVDLLERHVAKGNIAAEVDIELAAEHFLALVEAMPSKLADFGVFRSPKQEDRRLRFAVRLFLNGVAAQR
jgi:TetR/AcrR family transcriptional regulator, mexJK operon transcriptional repressor